MRKIPVQNYMEGAQIHHTRVDQKVMIRQPSPDKEDFKKNVRTTRFWVATTPKANFPHETFFSPGTNIFEYNQNLV